jgi:hypothetical protein
MSDGFMANGDGDRHPGHDACSREFGELEIAQDQFEGTVAN